MVKNEEYKTTEKLSQCLDDLNDGKQLMIQEEEIQELVQVAALVKKSYQQDELPQLLIDEVVDTLANEFQAQKKKRPSQWLYSGFAGAAAAAIFLACSQFLLPQPIEQQLTQQIEDKIETPQIAAVAEPVNPSVQEEKSLAAIDTVPGSQLESKEERKSIAVIPAEEKTTPSVGKVLGNIIPAPLLPVEETNTQVAILHTEKFEKSSMRKSLAMENITITSLQVEKDLQTPPKSSKVMVIPNKTPKSTLVDAASGDIKQVYSLGLGEEIFITQSLSDESSAKKEVQALLKDTKDSKDTMNSLSVRVGQYHIKIEGYKTKEELKKIAETLVESEVEKSK